MYEVELKVRADHEPVRERLRALGADRRGVVRQIDTYYDAPHRDFAETDEAIRIRREEREDGEVTTRLTYKGPLVDAESKTREEIETAVADPDATRDIFDRLGFVPAGTVEKERTRYAHGGYTVVLDDVVDLGQFLEVEVEADDIDRAREGARALMADLGVDPDEHVRTSYLGMVLGQADDGAVDGDGPDD